MFSLFSFKDCLFMGYKIGLSFCSFFLFVPFTCGFHVLADSHESMGCFEYGKKYLVYSNDDIRDKINNMPAEIWNEKDIFQMKIELARRGDPYERKNLFVMLKSSIPNEKFKALCAMEILSDREAIFYLGEALSDPMPVLPWVQAVKPDGTFVIVDDVYVFPPSSTAASILSRLVKNPPLKKSYGNSEKYYLYSDPEIQVWRDWWKVEREQFEEFFEKEPTGEEDVSQ